MTDNYLNKFLKKYKKLQDVIFTEKDLNYFADLFIYKILSERVVNTINSIERKEEYRDLFYLELEDKEAEKYKEKVLDKLGFFIYPSYIYQNVEKKISTDINVFSLMSKVFDGLVIKDNSQILGNLFGFRNKRSSSLLNRSEKMSNEFFKHIKLIEKLKEDNYDLYISLINDLFYVSSIGKALNSSPYLPLEIEDLLIQLICISKKNINRIYDPIARSGSLLIRSLEKLKTNNIKDGLYGQDNNLNNVELQKLNTILHNIPEDLFNIIYGDTLFDPEYFEGKKFDVVLSNILINPKWDLKSKRLLEENKKNSFDTTLISMKDSAVILHLLEFLSDEGLAILLVNSSLFYRNRIDQDFREFLINSNLVDTVIQLPNHLLKGNNSQLGILILRKYKDKKETYFIDVSNIYEQSRLNKFLSEKNIKEITNIYKDRKDRPNISKIVSSENIVKENYNLSPKIYLISNLQDQFDKVSLLKDKGVTIELGTYDINRIRKKGEKKEAKIFNVGDLKTSIINKVDYLGSHIVNKDVKLLRKGDIIIPRNFSNLKASIFIPDNEDILVAPSRSMLIIRIDKSILDPYFLLAYLNSSLVKDQLERRAHGSVLKIMDKRIFEKLQIPDIPLSKQKDIGENYLKLLEEQKKLNQKLKENEEKLNNIVENSL